MKRLHQTEDIQNIWKKVRPTRSEGFLVRIQPSSVNEDRVGIIIPKKYLKKAVERNRVKRKLREEIRLLLKQKFLYPERSQYDILLVLSRKEDSSESVQYSRIVESIRRLLLPLN